MAEVIYISISLAKLPYKSSKTLASVGSVFLKHSLIRHMNLNLSEEEKHLAFHREIFS